jgi:hypothetical protein
MGGKASALGRTQGGGAVDAAAAISNFMGGAGGATSAATTKATAKGAKKAQRGLLDALTGGAGAKKAGGASAAGSKTPKGTSESGVASSAGAGASSGLPTTADDGTGPYPHPLTITVQPANSPKSP